MLFSFAFALYFLALYVYGIKFSKKKKKKKKKISAVARPGQKLSAAALSNNINKSRPHPPAETN